MFSLLWSFESLTGRFNRFKHLEWLTFETNRTQISLKSVQWLKFYGSPFGLFVGRLSPKLKFDCFACNNHFRFLLATEFASVSAKTASEVFFEVLAL